MRIPDWLWQWALGGAGLFFLLAWRAGDAESAAILGNLLVGAIVGGLVGTLVVAVRGGFAGRHR